MTVKVLFTLLALGATAVVADQELKAIVSITTPNVGKYNVTGQILFTQSTSSGPVTVTGTLYGLTAGIHGFHIHQTGDLITNGCISAGGHFNPDNHSHGAPEDSIRHVGDLGNIVANGDGIANVQITDNIISLCGRNSILGRSVVVHALQDDLGKGNHQLSLTTGNAGDRAGCGVIGVLSPVDSWVSNSGGSNFWSSSTFLIPTGMTALLVRDKFYR